MFTDFLVERFQGYGTLPALVWQDRVFDFSDMVVRFNRFRDQLRADGVGTGTVVGLEGDFSPNTVALFLALIDEGCIVVPQSNVVHKGRDRKDDIAEIEYQIDIDAADNVTSRRTGRSAGHELYATLRYRRHPGLVLFSSGTSGDPKGAVHDFTFLLEKYVTQRSALSTLNFLLFDHWGGLNTLLHTLSNGGTTVTVRDRSPEAICQLIERFGIALLPATPTFLNLLLLSGAYKNYDLSSLRVITYGAEPMPESTLQRLATVFPNVKLQQTYGLIEVGVLRSKSKDNGSLWVKLGGEGFETRVVDGLLQIKARSTILGYLNAPSPITADGWFMTGDAVEQDGDYFRVLGRKSEIINVGGEKVYPIEVESVIQAMENVVEVTVFGEKNPLIGNIVCAKVRLAKPQDAREFTDALKLHCQGKLERFKVPVKVSIVDEQHFGDRFKKARAEMSK